VGVEHDLFDGRNDGTEEMRSEIDESVGGD
jgi:hypothetical protein